MAAVCLAAYIVKPARAADAAAASAVSQGVVTETSFDRDAGTVSYTLTSAAYVRLRVGAEDGPMYATVVDWQRREAGTQSESYAGTALEGGKAVFSLNYFTDNDADARGLKLTELLPHPAQVAVGKALPSVLINQIHKAHTRDACRDPSIIVRVAGARQAKEGYRLRPGSAVVIDISARDRRWFVRERFQVHIFVDDVFVHGILEGYVPYTWNFNLKDLNPGRHVIAVNLVGYADHIGSALAPVMVEGEIL